MPSQDNPAGRLHRLIARGKRLEPNTRIGDAWGQLLGTNPNDPIFFRRMARVMEMPRLLQSQLELLSAEGHIDDLSLYTRWAEPVRGMLSAMNLQGPWEHAIRSISTDVLLNLEFCDHELHRRRPELTISDEELATFRQHAQELLTQLIDMDLTPAVKELVRRHLRAVIDAIDDVPLHGLPPIQYAVEAGVGTVIVNMNLYAAAGGEQARKDDLSVLKRLWTLVEKIAVVVSLVYTPPALPPALQYLRKELPAPTRVEPDHPETQPRQSPHADPLPDGVAPDADDIINV